MKKLIFTLTALFSALLLCHAGGYGLDDSVYEGDVTLSTQAEVDAFHYTEVTGNLKISGSEITNVDALSALKVVKSLSIVGATTLTNVNGLSALAQVGYTNEGIDPSGFIEITGNSMLGNLDGLSAITTVYGPITIDNNASLETVNGFSGLTIVTFDLIIRNNLHLKSIDGFKNVESIWRPFFTASLIINNNASLTNIDGLSSLRSVEGKGTTVMITNNAMLVDIDGLSSLTSFSPYGSGLEISHNPSLKNIDGLRSISWFGFSSLFSLIIHDNASLENLDGLSSIRQFIPESYTNMIVHITKNPSLASCEGLYPLLSLMGPEIIAELTALGNIDVSENGSGCTVEDILANGPPMTVFEGDVTLSTQAEVDAFHYNEVTGGLTISGNDITNVDALSALKG